MSELNKSRLAESENTQTPGQIPAKEKKAKQPFFTTRSITMMAVFTAFACVLYIVPIFQFKLPVIFPGFLEFQFSDLPVLLCGFMFGPLHGLIVLALKIAIKLPFSSSFYVGELGDLIIGLSFLLPSSLIYRFKHNFKGALIGLSAGMLFSTLMAVIVNRFILIPLFVKLLPFLNGDINNLVASLAALYKNITLDNFYAYYLCLGVIPFNLLRGLISAGITLLVYKRLSRSVKSLFSKERKKDKQSQ